MSHLDREYTRSTYADLQLAEARIKELEAEVERLRDEYVGAIGTLRAIGDAVGDSGDEYSILAAVRGFVAHRRVTIEEG